MDKNLAKIAKKLYKSGDIRRAAVLYEQAGDFEHAIKAYDEVRNFVKAGHLSLHIGKGEDAASFFLKAGKFELLGQFYQDRKQYGRSAHYYIRAGQYSKAAEMYEIQLKSYPELREIPGEVNQHSDEEVKIVRLTASAHSKAGDYRRAAQLYERIKQYEDVARNYLSIKDYFSAGQAYEQAKLFAEAGQAYSDGELYLEAAKCFVQDKSFRLAAENYAKSGNFIEAGDYYSKAGDIFDAADSYKQGAELDQAIKVLSMIQAENPLYIRAIEKVIEFCREKGYVTPAAKRLFLQFWDAGFRNEYFDIYYKIGILLNQSEFVEEAKNINSILQKENAEKFDLMKDAFEFEQRESVSTAEYQNILEEDFEAQKRREKYDLLKQKMQELNQVPSDSDTLMSDFDSTLSEGERQYRPQSFTHIQEGQKFSDRYLIVKKLGSGGMGTVYKATDLELDEVVAIKILSHQLNFDENAVARFKQEIKLARQINHPNIIRIFDIGEYAGIRFITMEYFPGYQIKEIINENGFYTISEGLDLMLEVCEGLNAAHKLGIIHRDIKSQNIMISDQGVVKVLDFGIAKSADIPGLTLDGSILGTPEYISPEAIMQSPVDVRSDIYSLGIVMYEVFAGRVPFTGDSIMAVIRQHLYDDPPRPKSLNPNIPDDLEDILLTSIEREPGQRYQSIAELRSELLMLKAIHGRNGTTKLEDTARLE